MRRRRGVSTIVSHKSHPSCCMNTPLNSQNPQQTPEEYAAFLRGQTEEAVSASVHHASLSQQYLTLSQKLSAMSEQAASGDSILVAQSTGHPERKDYREKATDSIVVVQIAPKTAPLPAPTPAPQKSNATAFVTAALAELSTTGTVPVTHAIPQPIVFPESRTQIEEPPSGVSTAALPAESSDAVTDGQTSVFATPDAVDDSQTISLPGPSRKQRPSSSPKLLDRAKAAARGQAERMGLRARKASVRAPVGEAAAGSKVEVRQSRTPIVVSAAINGLALLLLGLKQLEFLGQPEEPSIVAGFLNANDAENLFPEEPPMMEVGEQQEQPVEFPVDVVVEELQQQAIPEAEQLPAEIPELRITESMPPPASALPSSADGNGIASPLAGTGTDPGGVGNRSDAGRKNLVKKFGGSVASESAVGDALIWLSSRQRPNGSWDFVDVGPCSNPGTAHNPIGGTAYALLPFLAAGQTHRDGQYKKQVQAGLDFLMTVGVSAQAGYDLRGVVNKSDKDEDPNYAYYVHGAATLALCEAYGMTKDRKLKPAAESAVLFLINSQDPQGGGWRYNPQQPGSTSATAIQLMALKAAEKAGMKIPESTFRGVSFYLDSVAVDGEGRYGYEIEKKQYGVSVTSMALLSRMYLGWGRDDGDLRAGVALVDKRGPYDNLYYNYFATQVMKNWGGREWDRWNGRLRDDLVAWQEKDGDAKGSWAPRDRDDYSRAGGRLLTTCLATLTLEVYYRYHPLLPEFVDDAAKPAELAGRNTDAAPANVP